AFMATRVPRSLEAVRETEAIFAREGLKAQAGNPEILRAQLDRYIAETGDPNPPTLEELIENIRNFDERFTLDVDDRHPLAVSLRLTPEVAAQLVTMNWWICDAPSGAFFITGDCPLTIFVPVGRQAIFGGGLAQPAVQVTFPLSPTVCLVLDRRGGALRR